MSKKYVDNRAVIQVLGTIFKHPYLLDEQDRYFISTDDFVEPFHKLIYSTVFNLRLQGAGKIELLDIENYLSSKPGLHKIYNDNKGAEYLVDASSKAEFDNFNYYFNRLKKFSLLRGLHNMGIDMTGLYDPDELFDGKKIKEQAEWLDNVKLEDIPAVVNDKIEAIKHEYLGRMIGDGQKMGVGALELIERLQETPEIGVPLYGNYINKVTRGARLKKFYLRSAPSGVGKSRMMMADACNFACDEIYQNGKWIENGQKEPTLFITTELEIDECQTMALAFLSDVNEDHILDGKYHKGELERVKKAANLLNNSPIWVEHMPDFSLSDIEGAIKRQVRENGVKYVCHDYIHTSMKILEEITKRSGGVKLREDNILFMLAIRLKDLANELGIFIMSATQLNGDWMEAKEANQNLLRGAKSIADKIDFGAIALPVTDVDKECLGEMLQKNGLPMPDIALHIYKNRRGKFKSVKLWCHADLGTCRVNAIFMTDNSYNHIPISDINIVVKALDDELPAAGWGAEPQPWEV